ncbi:MAG: hypothetical protein OSB23_10125 [Porticoccaceae bacterium]|nr:hypothetical protein [Porticoccaceae bacterium]|tara:strand:- start:143 stop:604 length:462 start_codon:yes stop_codon:yes gene_type:complete
MIKASISFLISVAIATVLLITQTTFTNLVWLSSMDMPIDVSVILSMMASDLISMNIKGEFPVGALVLVGMLIAFIVTRILLIWVNIDKRYLYALAGGATLFAIVGLMPLAFYNLDLIAGARSVFGKGYLIFTGMIAGYYFGARQTEGSTNESH